MGGAVTELALTLNIAQTLASARRLQQRVPIAAARAVNRSIASGKTLGTRLVANDLGIGQSSVRDRIKILEAKPSPSPVAQLLASAKRIPSFDFGATPKEPPSRGRGRGVSWRSQGRRVRDPQTFIAKMRSGHVGIFKREGKDRESVGAWSKNLPVRELMGPSIAHVFGKHGAEILARAQEQLVKNTQHELRFAFSKA